MGRPAAEGGQETIKETGPTTADPHRPREFSPRGASAAVLTKGARHLAETRGQIPLRPPHPPPRRSGDPAETRDGNPPQPPGDPYCSRHHCGPR